LAGIKGLPGRLGVHFRDTRVSRQPDAIRPITVAKPTFQY
jgi:hypothetical protein